METVLSPPHPLQPQLAQNQIPVTEDNKEQDVGCSSPKSRKRRKSDSLPLPSYSHKTRRLHQPPARGYTGRPQPDLLLTSDSKDSWAFLLGGNVHDPLNLNGLQPSDNALTPKTSPMPVPEFKLQKVPIYVPKDTANPLKLGGEESPDPRAISSRTHQQRHPIVSPVLPSKLQLPILPPEITQAPLNTLSTTTTCSSSEMVPPATSVEPTTSKTPYKFRPKDKIFQWGNYNQYYGYRNPGGEDARLRVLQREWIEDKDVLDIGCNIGHVSLSIGRDFSPRRVVGIDIDPILIRIANKNMKHYVDRDPLDSQVKFPQSLSIVHGRLQPPQTEAIGLTPDRSPSLSATGKRKIPFPYNVLFRQENYVLESESLLCSVQPQYDLILCLSVTKWVHLNCGDEGLKLFFRRVFRNLRAGGVFVLEPQPWSSYKKKKKMTEETFQMFQGIKFLPDQFQSYLLGSEVGFAECKQVGIPAHQSRGFQRPIYVFTKAATNLDS